MITLLSKFFVKADMDESKKRSVFGVLCGAVGIFLNIILFAIKLFAGMISNSVSIMADAFNNLSDAGSSIVTLLGFKLASAKADETHPYGHGRVEYISGFVVATTIILMGFELLKESIGKIMHPEAVEFSPVIIFILIVSILIKLYMAFYNYSVGNKIDSAPVKATAFDSISDCGATTAVLVSTIIGHIFSVNIDGYCGVLVSIFIFIAGKNAAKEALDPLLGIPPEEEFIDSIEDIVMNFEPELILGMHDLMVHDYGPGRRIISLHAEVPASGDILKIHDVIDCLERELCVKLGCVATIHMDPIVVDDPKVTELREKVNALVAKLLDGVKTHDFRVVFGDTHTNIIFDMALPFSLKLTDDEAAELIKKAIKEEIGKEYFAVIDIDRENYILK